MSYEAWGEPDDEYISYEAALDAGWLTPDDADELHGKLFAASWTRMVFLACVADAGTTETRVFELARAVSALGELYLSGEIEP
jgi:hypothetical protein